MIAPLMGKALRDAVIGAWRRWRRRRATRRALMALDDRRLKDIGVARCDIPRRAREAGMNSGTQPRK